MTVEEMIEKFIQSRIRRGLSDRTVENYESRLKLFRQFCDGKDSVDLTPELVEDYIDHVMGKRKENVMLPGKKGKRIAKDTQYTYLNVLRIFLNWSEKRGYIVPLANYVELPKRNKKLVDIYTPDEMEEIFEALHNSVPWIELRNRALIAVMYDSGLRLSEVLSITQRILRSGRNSIKITGKGSKDRYVPLGTFTKECLDKYLAALPDQLDPDDPIFRSNRGKPLNVDNVERIFYRLRKRTGFSVSPHKLRHNFATNFLADQYREKGSADIYQLMLILGHSDVQTCKIYLHIAQALVIGEGSYSHLDKIFSMSPDEKR